MTDELLAVWQATPFPDLLTEAYWEGKRDFVPILGDDAAVRLAQAIVELRPKRILEIGTAIGYSGLMMLGLAPEASMVTLDVDPDRLERANDRFARAGVQDRVRVIQEDAISFLGMTDMTFDFVLLDGPKGHYAEMTVDLLRVLSTDGRIFVDDVNYLGLVEGENEVIHKHRTIVCNMRAFVKRVKEDPSLEVRDLATSGGAMIIRKRY